jgi:surface polysaccharide O-acyltransferase-like enzyme
MKNLAFYLLGGAVLALSAAVLCAPSSLRLVATATIVGGMCATGAIIFPVKQQSRLIVKRFYLYTAAVLLWAGALLLVVNQLRNQHFPSL